MSLQIYEVILGKDQKPQCTDLIFNITSIMSLILSETSVVTNVQEPEDIGARIIERLDNGHNVCVFGQPGTGKTTLIHRIVKEAKDKPVRVICVAATGRAAMNMVDGITIHRFAGLMIGDLSYYPYMDVKGKKHVETHRYKVGRMVYPRKHTRENLEKVSPLCLAPRLLIIVDELGIATSELFTLFYERIMWRRREFGLSMDGVTWALFGDFGQMLPPTLNARLLFEPTKFLIQTTVDKKVPINRPNAFSLTPISDSNIGAHFEVHALTKIWRQADPIYLQVVNWLYWGKGIHPALLERVYKTPPENAVTIYFNNDKVLRENTEFIKDFIERHANNTIIKRTFRAIYSNMPEKPNSGIWRDLLPVTKEYTIAIARGSNGSLIEGMPFMVTVNVPDPGNKDKLLVANGELVTIIDISETAVTALKSNGTKVYLSYVDHLFSDTASSNGRTAKFLMLPGYPGHSCTIYKVQGLTFDEGNPRTYAVWEVVPNSTKTKPLNRAGALTVCFSRNRSLDDVYITGPSGDVDETLSYLQQSLVTDDRVIKFLLDGKEPTWVRLSDYSFVELTSVEEQAIKIKGENSTLYWGSFDLYNWEEKLTCTNYRIGFVRLKDNTIPLFIGNNQTPIGSELQSLSNLLRKIFNVWYTDYKPKDIYKINQ